VSPSIFRSAWSHLGPWGAGLRTARSGRCRSMRLRLVQTHGRGLRLRAFGCLRAGESEPPSCAHWPSAHAAAREAGNPAARAAGHAAASAYTHPLADVHQTKHIVGPAAYAALALELDHGGDPNIGEGEVHWAIEHAPPEVREVLQQMPARQAGNSRLDTLFYELDAGLRSRTLPKDAEPGVQPIRNNIQEGGG
jgi:hypothetical protein